MNIDRDSIKGWIETGVALISGLKAAKDLLPAGPKRTEAEAQIAETERQLKIAEAALAKALDFEICPRCWPPEIMVVGAHMADFRCRGCGQGMPPPPPEQRYSVRTR